MRNGARSPEGRSPVGVAIARLPLGRKALTTLGAAACQNTLATNGHHALTEAVAALANKAARLIGTFHGSSPTSLGRVSRKATGRKSLFFRGLNQFAGPSLDPLWLECCSELPRYRGGPWPSQRTRHKCWCRACGLLVLTGIDGVLGEASQSGFFARFSGNPITQL